MEQCGNKYCNIAFVFSAGYHIKKKEKEKKTQM